MITPSTQIDVQELLEAAHFQFEKCELIKAKNTYYQAVEAAERLDLPREKAKGIVGLVRAAHEALDYREIADWERELLRLIEQEPIVAPMAHYTLGAVAARQGHWMKAQRLFHLTLRTARIQRKSGLLTTSSLEQENREAEARALAMLGLILLQRGKLGRALFISRVCEERFGALRGIRGSVEINFGLIAQARKDFSESLRHYQNAHSAYLSEHNWYHYLYVLYRYASLARERRSYREATWYLNLIAQAARGPEFGALAKYVKREREQLENDAVDLLIDTRKGIIQTREGGTVSLRKQYVLMDILRALSKAHDLTGEETERGLSKAQIIRTVWKERYRPEAHDNKLYYNINRLRKLIEPDVRRPRYVLNWKEGYRLSPGLRIQFLDEAEKELDLSQLTRDPSSIE
jgi:DNA-binding winged helix-turn-helix (wHTH) protein